MRVRFPLAYVQFGYFDAFGEGFQARDCKDPRALGWIAAAFVIMIVLFGGLVLPTVLIGVISISFDECAKEISAESREHKAISKIRAKTEEWQESFVTDEQISALRSVFDTINFDSNEDEEVVALEQHELLPFLSYVTLRYLEPLKEVTLQEMVRGVHVGFISSRWLAYHSRPNFASTFPRSRTQQFDVVDNDGDGQVTWPEFLWFLVFIKKQLPSNAKGGMSHKDAIRRASLQNGTPPALSDDAEETKSAGSPEGASKNWQTRRTSSWARSVDLDGDSNLEYYERGLACEANGDALGALHHYRACVGRTTGQLSSAVISTACEAAAATRLGGLLGAAGELDEAELVLRAACAVSMAEDTDGIWHERAAAPCNLAIVLELRGDEAGAERAYRDALAIDPARLAARRGLVDVLERTGRLANACAAGDVSLGIAPGTEADLFAARVFAGSALDDLEVRAPEGSKGNDAII